MTRLKLLLLLSFISVNSVGQDLQSVQKLIATNDYEGAKKQIDEIFNDKQQADAAAWFYRGKIYTEIVRRQDSLNTGLLQEALKAYKRYQELDPQNKLMELDNNVGLFQLYDLSFNNGVIYYNGEQYGLAFRYFKNALDVEEYIAKKKFSFNGKQFPALDTQLVSLTGFSAWLSKNEEESIPYFVRLADLRMAGEEFKGMYTLLYQYFQKRNDAVRATKYLSTGKQLFPDEDYWMKLEMGKPAGEKEKFARYEFLLQKYPSNVKLLMNYVIDLFNYTYADQKPADLSSKQERLNNLLNKLVALDKESAKSWFIFSQHHLNQLYGLEDEARSIEENSPAEEARKKAIQAKIKQKYEDLLNTSLESFNLYEQNGITDQNRQDCRKLLNQLVSCYQKKNQSERVEFYREKLRSL